MTHQEKAILRQAIREDKKPSEIDPTQLRKEDLDYMYLFGRIGNGEGVASFHTEEGELTQIVFFDF